MDLESYARILRKRWRVIPVVTLMVVILAAVLTALTPKTYQSNIQFFVSTSGAQDAAQLSQGSTFAQQRVKSYTELLKTPKVLQPVLTSISSDETPADLSSRVTATIPVDTVLIDVAVTDREPEQARTIAAAISKQFPPIVEDLERVRASGSSPVKVTVVKEPVPSPAVVNPRPVRNMILALVFGLLLGVTVAIVRHMLDSRVRSKEDIEELTDAHVIGTIPFDSEASALPLIVQTDSQSSRAEAYRSLRTNLRFVDADHPPRTIVVTSSLAREGKTTTSANLALAIAAGGASVCVIEADLRRPQLLEYLGMEGGVGLTDVLIGRVALDDVLQPYGDRRLTVLGAGAIPPNPSELLGSTSMRELLGTLQARFDYVLVDTPPLLPVTDAAVLSALVDGVVVVSGSGIASRDQLRTALESLQSVDGRILGIVLNRMPRKTVGTYYGYDYRPASGDAGRRHQPTKKMSHREAPRNGRQSTRSARHGRTGDRSTRTTSTP